MRMINDNDNDILILILILIYTLIYTLILILIMIFLFIAMIIDTIYFIIMETIFMNTENSKTNAPHSFRLDLTDKLNLKNPKKNIDLVNLSIYYTWKNIKSEYINNKLKYLRQLGMKLLIYLMVLILLMTFKITLNLSSKSMRL